MQNECFCNVKATLSFFKRCLKKFLSLQSDEFSISLENGAVVLNNRGVKVKSHKKQYNDGRSHFLLASVNNQK